MAVYTTGQVPLPGGKVDLFESSADQSRYWRAAELNQVRDALQEVLTDVSPLQVTSTGSAAAKPLKDWFSAAEVIRPSGDTSGATDVSAINAATSAGKAVQLTGGVYYVNAPINLGNGSTGVGYTIRGVPWAIDGTWSSILSGTEIRAVGATACMAYVPTTYAAQPTAPQLHAEALKGVNVQDLAFSGCTYAIQIGSQFNTGVFWSTFKNLAVIGWTQWGFWFENVSLSHFEKVYAVNGATTCAGNIMFAASQSAYNHGNNTILRVFAQNSSKNQRGIVFRSYGGTSPAKVYFNDLNAFDLQNNQGGQVASATATSSGSTTLTLSAYGSGASIASFPVDMPITVASTSLGLKQWQTYFVVANDGVSTIQIADTQHGSSDGGSAKTVSAGSVTIYANGFPSIEVVGYTGSSGYSQISASTFRGVDAEGTAGCEVLVQNAVVDLGITYANYSQGWTVGQVFTTLVARRSYGHVSASMQLTTDFDSISWRVPVFGGQYPTDVYPTTSNIGTSPAGIVFDSGMGVPTLNLYGFSPFPRSLHSQNTDTSAFLYPDQPMGQKVSYSANAGPFFLTASQGGGSIAYTGAGAGTWTLPRLRSGTPGPGSTAASGGETYDVANAGGGALTLNTWSATNGANSFNGNTGATDDGFMRTTKNSYSCPVGSSITVRANYDGTKAFWQVIANSGCT